MGIGMGATAGNTIPSIAAALLIRTKQPQISTVAALAEIPCLHGRRTLGNSKEPVTGSNKEPATGHSKAPITGALMEQIDPVRVLLRDQATLAPTVAAVAEIT